MEEQFGPVADANVIQMETDDQLTSRGFGFVTFKDDKSVAAALEAHYTSIWGKKAEIKSAVLKRSCNQEDRGDEPQQETEQQESNQSQLRGQTERSSAEDMPKKMSWADRVGHAQPDDSGKECKARRPRFAGQDTPRWFITFKKWLPQFLRKLSRNSEGGSYYSLSSLKSDFKTLFGLELDHASLGYSKLSDFVKSYPELCRVKIVHTGGQVPNHMILLPNVPRPPPLALPRNRKSVARPTTPVHVHIDDASDCGNMGLSEKEAESDTHSDKTSETYLDATAAVNEVYGKPANLDLRAIVPTTYSRFLQFLEPDTVFLARTWLGTGGFKVPDQECRRKHLVLEALARKRKQVFFLRGLNFYDVRCLYCSHNL